MLLGGTATRHPLQGQERGGAGLEKFNGSYIF